MKRERIIRPLLVSLTLILSAVALTGCATKPGVAAEVDGTIVTEAQVEALTTEVDDFFRQVGSGSSTLRLYALDALIYKEIAKANSDKQNLPLADFDPQQEREQFKAEIEQGCQGGKDKLTALEDSGADNGAAVDDMRKQVDAVCGLTKKVDGLSDDALLFRAVDNLRKANQVPLLYLAVQQAMPDTHITTAPRYGTLDQRGLHPHTPGSVTFIPRQG